MKSYGGIRDTGSGISPFLEDAVILLPLTNMLEQIILACFYLAVRFKLDARVSFYSIKYVCES